MPIIRSSLIILLLTATCFAHPGSGIVIDRNGVVYFVDTGSGIWRINSDRTLTKLSAPAYHWMALDTANSLAHTRLPRFGRGDAVVANDEAENGILVSSDFPITVGPDGALYYPWLGESGLLSVYRLTPSGKTTVHATLPASTESGRLRWLNGIAASKDGSIYYSEARAVRRVSSEGTISTVAANVTVRDCESIPGVEPSEGANLRGLAVDEEGTVYVTASGCGTVLKITKDGKISTFLRTQSPWSPTGVALHGREVYVLEYLHTPGDDRREWLPRVRKVTPDGKVETIAIIEGR